MLGSVPDEVVKEVSRKQPTLGEVQDPAKNLIDALDKQELEKMQSQPPTPQYSEDESGAYYVVDI